jgi:hypothetical protein
VCGKGCSEPTKVKLGILLRFTDDLVRERIDPRHDLSFTERAFRKLVRDLSGAPPAPPGPTGKR